ncbi:MAG: T9SS type A sorting domain-containing protein [Chloroherpetonaceae bacterium]|nr:T9SS type A sorting domain-containing protein [Chloroherpetonaceae bacterium]
MKKILLLGLLLATTNLFGQSFPQNGLVYWLKADSGVDTTTDGRVQTWANSVAPVNTARQTVAANQPRYIASGLNSKPVIQFDGNDILVTDSSISVNQFSVYIIFNSTTTGSKLVFEQGTNANSSSGFYLNTSTVSTVLINKSGSQIGKDYVLNWANDGQYKLTSLINNNFSSDVLLRVNGSEVPLTNSLVNPTQISGVINQKLYIGSRANLTVGLVGNIAEILIYNRALGFTESNYVENYLATKYGLAFTPFSVPTNGLALWMRADSKVDTTASGKVSSWQSHVGTNSLIQTEDAKRPRFIKNNAQGRPAIQFDGTNVLLSQAPVTLNQFTVFSVLSSTTSGLGIIYEHSSDVNSRPGGSYLSTSSGATISAKRTALIARNLQANWANSGNTIVVSNVHSNAVSDFALRVNGQNQVFSGSPVGTNTGSVNVVDTLFLGGRGYTPSLGLIGKISEFLIYNRALSTTEISNIEDYLTDKYINGNFIEPLSFKGFTQKPTEGFELAQNYPNPFNPTTTIQFRLPQSGFTELTIYDMLGRKVSTLINQRMEAGLHRVNFNAQSLASGVYFYRLSTGNFSMTKKMTLIK